MRLSLPFVLSLVFASNAQSSCFVAGNFPQPLFCSLEDNVEEINDLISARKELYQQLVLAYREQVNVFKSKQKYSTELKEVQERAKRRKLEGFVAIQHFDTQAVSHLSYNEQMEARHKHEKFYAEHNIDQNRKNHINSLIGDNTIKSYGNSKLDLIRILLESIGGIEEAIVRLSSPLDKERILRS